MSARRVITVACLVGVAIVLMATLASARVNGRGCQSLDVNRDHRITAADALLVLRASVGLDRCGE